MATITKDGVAYITVQELKDMLISNNFTVNVGEDYNVIPRIVLLQDTFMYEPLKECVDLINVILTKAQIARIFMNSTPV